MRITTSRTSGYHNAQGADNGRIGPFVDPEDLMCPGCGERPVRCEPPGYWKVADGLPTPQFSHHDATPLCRTADGTVADPIEAR